MDDDEKPAKERELPPGWLVGYADLMSLMLVFFVLLFSLSTVDEIKTKLVFGSLHSTFRRDGILIESNPEVTRTTPISRPAKDFQNRVQKLFDQEFDLVQSSDYDLGEQMQIVVPTDELFIDGRSQLRPDRQEFLVRLADAMTDLTVGGRPELEFIVRAYLDGDEASRAADMLNVERTAMFAAAMTRLNVPAFTMTTGAYPFDADEVEFYFYLRDIGEGAVTFDDVLQR